MLALPLIWLACAIAGGLYAAQQGIPFRIAFAALPAFLLEAAFYAVLGIERWRARLEKLYGVNQRLDLSNGPDGGLRVDITIPFQELPHGPAAEVA